MRHHHKWEEGGRLREKELYSEIRVSLNLLNIPEENRLNWQQSVKDSGLSPGELLLQIKEELKQTGNDVMAVRTNIAKKLIDLSVSRIVHGNNLYDTLSLRIKLYKRLLPE